MVLCCYDLPIIFKEYSNKMTWNWRFEKFVRKDYSSKVDSKYFEYAFSKFLVGEDYVQLFFAKDNNLKLVPLKKSQLDRKYKERYENNFS